MRDAAASQRGNAKDWAYRIQPHHFSLCQRDRPGERAESELVDYQEIRKTMSYSSGIYTVRLVCEKQLTELQKVRSPQEVFEILRPMFAGLDREQMVAVYTATSGRIMGVSVISIGTINASLVHPREVFKVAIMLGASSVVIAHNHPGGTGEASREDREITRQLVDAGTILGIPLRDHLILFDDTYISFAEHGWIE